MRRIGLVDVDLLDKGTRFPNLALMKLSSAHKSRGNETTLCFSYEDAAPCDALFCSKVFTRSNEPAWLEQCAGKRFKGGTGYFGAESPKLALEVEHARPDYDLYAPYVAKRRASAKTPEEYKRINTSLEHYTCFSLGFTTRGCFRACPFCVNRNSKGSRLWSPVAEFLDESRPFIALLDDNVFACKDWRAVFDSLQETRKLFSFRQGLDLRLMSEEKARTLERARYWGDVFFAFDNLKDAAEIESALKTYRSFCRKPTRCYVLVGFYEQGIAALRSALDRIEILSRYRVIPYVMRFETCYQDDFSPIFSGLAAWANQPGLWKNCNYFDVNVGRSHKAVDAASRLLPSSLVERLKKNYWELK